MAIDIPREVALFLNICGVPYPDINEDDVRALAGHVRTFAEQVQGTHDSATGVIDQMGAFYSGESYQQLVATWATMSSTHMRQLESACKLVGQALEVAATVITAVKVAVLAELAALAATYASIMITPPLAPSAPLVAAAARKLCEQMAQYLIGYIVAEVIGKAIEPLEQAIDDMVKGIVYDATRDALDIPSSGKPPPLRIDPDAVQHFAKVLDDHADDIMRHAATFAENVATLDFTTSTPFDDAVPPTATAGGSPPGPAPTPEQLIRRHGEQPEARVGPAAAAAPTVLDRHGTGDARVPAAVRDAANPAAPGQRAADRNGGGAGAPDRTGNRSAAPAGTGPRDPASDPAKMSPVAGVAPNDANPNADRSAEVASPSAVSARDGADVARVAAHDVAPEVPGRGAFDFEVRPAGTESAVAAAAVDVPPVDTRAPDSAEMGGPLTGAATPWGRAGQPPVASDPAPKPAQPAKVPPKVRRPVATPWTKKRRAREAPAVVHAPATRPPLRSVPEKGSEGNGAVSAGVADAPPAPSRVTAPASDRIDPPPP
ncbi:WXG100 family type VII secretion target [Nocardia gamkensis]|uniref:WXG100-like domain-containing protein n=1 Tax=Nocardia gamkensis TaxID=352869 RepID=UPI0033EAD0C6